MATLIERQIDDWEKRGVIDAPTARTLRADAGAMAARPPPLPQARKQRRFSFFQVVSFFAAVSIGAAVVLFIAANWEAIPRLVRAMGAAAIIFAGFVAGGYVNRRQGLRMRLVEEACYLVAGAGFVAGVALVGQMYHISDDVQETAFLYAAGLGLSGLAVRSTVLVAAGGLAITYWQVNGPHAGNLLSLQFLLFAVAIAMGLAFAAMRKEVWLRRAFYALAVVGILPFLWSVLEWLVDLYEAVPEPVRNTFWVLVWAVSLAGLAAERWRPGTLRSLPGLRKPRPAAFFAAGLVSIVFIHGEFGADAGLVLASSMAIVFVLVGLYAHARDIHLIRYVGYAVFAAEVLIVYGQTVYSLLGTSGFFLALGVVLALIALVVYRMERRWKSRGPGEESRDA